MRMSPARCASAGMPSQVSGASTDGLRPAGTTAIHVTFVLARVAQSQSSRRTFIFMATTRDSGPVGYTGGVDNWKQGRLTASTLTAHCSSSAPGVARPFCQAGKRACTIKPPASSASSLHTSMATKTAQPTVCLPTWTGVLHPTLTHQTVSGTTVLTACLVHNPSPRNSRNSRNSLALEHSTWTAPHRSRHATCTCRRRPQPLEAQQISKAKPYLTLHAAHDQEAGHVYIPATTPARPGLRSARGPAACNGSSDAPRGPASGGFRGHLCICTRACNHSLSRPCSAYLHP